MKMESMLKLVVYPIFEKGGHFDKAMAMRKAKTVALKQFVTDERVWDFNMKMPCNRYENVTNTTDNSTKSTDVRGKCMQVKGWVGVRGVSDDAADMKNFRVANEKNVTLAEIDTNLAFFKKYQVAMNSTNVTNAVKLMMMIISADIDKEIDILKDLNKTKVGRMLPTMTSSS